MGIEQFEILLDNPKAIYLSNQTVSGRIKISINKVKKIRGLEVFCTGEAFTSWQKRQFQINSGQYSHQKNNFFVYEGKEKYFKYKYFLLGGKSQEIELPAKCHYYNFAFVLPSDLPPSFEHSKGYIRYSVRARLVLPWKNDRKVIKIITLANYLDLNQRPKLQNPKTVQIRKSVWSFWCKTGFISAKISVPQTGYVFGENIIIRCEIKNDSKVKIKEMKFYLKQLVYFSATYPMSEVEYTELKVNKKIRRQHVIDGEIDKFETSVEVPDVPPSNLSRCSIIDLKYKLEAVIILGGFHTELVAKIPIIIGTVPLGQENGHQPTAPDPEEVQSLTSVISWVAGLATPLLSRNEHHLQCLTSSLFSGCQKINAIHPTTTTALISRVEHEHDIPQINTSGVVTPKTSMLTSLVDSDCNIVQNSK